LTLCAKKYGLNISQSKPGKQSHINSDIDILNVVRFYA